ncbi:hypothetical protein Q5741_21310, partial [Paenibacillus sp. JX-17]
VEAGIPVDDIVYTTDPALPHILKTTENYQDTNAQSASRVTSYQYDTFGNVSEVQLQLDNNQTQRTEIAYSAAYKNAYPTSIKQHITVNGTPKTIEERYEYDLPTGRVTAYVDGNAVAKQAPAGSAERYEYDKVGRITKVTHPALSGEGAPSSRSYSFAYDTIAQQAVMTETDEEGKQTRQIYDGLGRPYAIQLQKVDSNNNTKFYTLQTNHYNDLGELDYVQDGEGHITRYEYNANGDLVAETSAEGRILGYAYNDALDQATNTTDYGEKITTTTDAIGRVTQSRRNNDLTGESITTTQTYDVNGDPFSMQAADGNGMATSFRSDGLHRLQDVTQTADSSSALLTTSYQYNKLGSLTEKVFPDLSKLSYSYDELGRRLSKTDSVLGQESYTYDDNSNITGGKTREGTSVLNQYDELNRLKAWSSGDKQGSFTYYNNGLRKTMTDETGTTKYEYQLDNQLKKVTYPDGTSIQYTYYDNGLRKSMTDPFGVTTTYLYNQDNQLKQVLVDSQVEAEYIYRDNLESSDENYKKSSQLYQARLAGGKLTTTYINDGFGRLSKLNQSADGFTKTYTYGYDNNDNITSRSDGESSGEFTYDSLNRILTSSEG